MTVNVLFFTQDTISTLNIEENRYSLLFGLPKSVFSSLISTVLIFILKFIAFSQGRVEKLRKKIMKKGGNHDQTSGEVGLIRLRIIVFYFVVMILLTFFSYYIGVFCMVYKNTEGQLIFNTLISFCLSNIYPIFLCWLPTLFRIKGIRNKNSCLFCISKFMQLGLY